MIKHTFVICAYKESPYLKECIESLRGQTIKSNILMVTSTPNTYIQQVAEQYQIPLYINNGEKGITQDWNFGYCKAKTPYITIAHQDDYYLSDYTQELLSKIEKAKKPLIYFTDYYELRNGKVVSENELLKVKRLMLLPLTIKLLQKFKWVRRRILSFGSPICCPSVGYVKKALPEQIFTHGFRSCEDWEAWEKISKLKGEFLYNRKPLIYHRIHGDSETSAIIGQNARSEEEYIMFRKFWPNFIAKFLVKQYARGQKSNSLD